MLGLLLCALAFACILWRLRGSPRRRRIAVTASLSTFAFTVLSATWLISDAFTGEGFNGAVIYHLRTGFEGAGVREYAPLVGASVAAIALALILGVWVYRRLPSRVPRPADGSSAWPAIALPLLCLVHPTVNATLRDYAQAFYGPGSYLDTFLNPEHADTASFDDFYVEPEPRWPAAPRRNLVVIYAESLEQTYFDEALFPGLMTELRELKPRATAFTNVRTAAGTGFTIAGLVATQCGLPLITAGHPNSMRGMDRFLSGATCLGDLLQERGYALHYLGGADLSFAGKGTFFRSHGFDSVMGSEELAPRLEDPDYVSTWGLYDDFLFEQLLERFDSLAQGEKPFGLFTLTMDTHHPRGHQSRSCIGLEYGDGSNAMLNAVRCADHLIARTLRTILAAPAAKDTLVVLASDHLALKNDAYELLTQGKRRNLLWLFEPGETGATNAAPATSLDTPVALLRALGAEVDAFALGRDVAGAGRDSLIATLPRINGQLRAWRDDFARFWELPGVIDTLTVDPVAQTVRVNQRTFQAPALITVGEGRMEAIRFEFDSRRKLLEYVRKADARTTLVWFDACSKVRAMDIDLPTRGLCLFAGPPGGRSALAQAVTSSVTLDRDTLKHVAMGFRSRSLLAERHRRLDSLAELGIADVRQRSVPTPILDLDAQLRVFSAGGPGALSALASAGGRHAMKRGLQLFRVSRAGEVIPAAHIDLCAMDAPPRPFAEHIRAQARPAHAYVLIAHDSATCGGPLDEVLAGLPLEAWRDLGFREPYIALFSLDGETRPLEFRGDRYSQLRIVFSGTEQMAQSGEG